MVGLAKIMNKIELLRKEWILLEARREKISDRQLTINIMMDKLYVQANEMRKQK